ncbi:MAG TPA: carboxypeptidase-like regulatory domain-containing protein [Candidatus Binataceae bacterium]|nr:carboxypeptidase-like regulatory domain-containing protein [Candidatus Binataceae bacterium]
MRVGLQTLLAICAFGLAVGGLAQASEVAGVVVDASGQPVAGVKITASHGHSSTSAVTDRDGQYSIKDLATGAYDLKIDPMGSGVKGGTVESYLNPAGLTVNWSVAPQQEPLASAQSGIQQPHSPSIGIVALGGGGGNVLNSKDSPPGCKGMPGPPCGPKSPHK